MKFKKEDLRELMVNDISPFEVIDEEDVESGHRAERMDVYVFKFEGKLYEFGISKCEQEGYHWFYVDDEHECPEVEAHEVVRTEYRAK